MRHVNDREIDLTVDRKFRNPTQKVVLFENDSNDTWIENVPWLRRRPLTSDNDIYRTQRLYGDKLSDDFGYIVRRDSIGRWVLFADKYSFTYPELVLEEWLYEEMGGERGLPIKYCYSCGKKFFSRGNLECIDCKLGSHSHAIERLSMKNKYSLTDNIRAGREFWRGHGT